MFGTLIAALRSVATYIAILIYIAIAGPLAIVAAVALRSKSATFALGRGGVGLGLAMAGIRYRVTGREYLPSTAVVFCSNHESNVDPPVLFHGLHPRLHVLYKAELHKFPIMGTLFDVAGYVPVDRSDRQKAIASLEVAAASLRAGNSFLNFPEGTRSRSGSLLPFKKGGFIMAIQAQVPIVPVAISGGRAAMRRGSPIVRPVHVSVRIGRPIPTTGLSVDDRDDLIARVRTEVETLRAAGSVWT